MKIDTINFIDYLNNPPAGLVDSFGLDKEQWQYFANSMKVVLTTYMAQRVLNECKAFEYIPRLCTVSNLEEVRRRKQLGVM